MRNSQTLAEATLWQAVRGRKLGHKIRRQHPIEHFIVDFYCAQARLCIEIDGDSHLEPAQEEYDSLRTARLEELGYKIIRFSNNDVRYQLQAVVDEIMRAIEENLDIPSF